MIDETNIVEILKEKKYHFQDYSPEELKMPFDLLPDDFLNKAEYNLNHNNLEDSLSNSKRAIDCQMDCLLYSFGLLEISKKKRWTFPKKNGSYYISRHTIS